MVPNVKEDCLAWRRYSAKRFFMMSIIKKKSCPRIYHNFCTLILISSTWVGVQFFMLSIPIHEFISPFFLYFLFSYECLLLKTKLIKEEEHCNNSSRIYNNSPHFFFCNYHQICRWKETVGYVSDSTINRMSLTYRQKYKPHLRLSF